MRVKSFRLVVGVLLALVIFMGLFPLGLAGQPTGHAQKDEATATFTPTQDIGDIFGFRQEILFPAVIRFVVGMNLGLDNIASLTLTLHQQSGFEQTVSLDLEKNLLQSAGVVSQFIYIWNLAEHPGLVPFETVNVRWEVKSIQEGKVSTAETEFMYEDDAHGSWETAGEPPLVLSWLNEHLAGSGIRNEVMAAYGLLSQCTKLSPMFRFTIYDPNPALCQEKRVEATNGRVSVVVSQEDKSQYPCSAAIYQQVYASGGMIFLQRPTLGYSELQDQLITRMVYNTYTTLWNNAAVPAWFLEGLAELYHLHPSIAALEVTRNAARQDTLFTLSALASPLPDTADFRSHTLWDSQSYLLALYLSDRYGAEAPFNLALDIPQQSDGFNGALQALTGGDQNKIWEEWNRWLFTDAAEKAVTWTPYVLTTPTPTTTGTATPIPPTSTPSNTPTITLTPTSTFRGDQAVTMIVQRVTPTRALTVTNTPLPPGSLPTSRPRPTTDTGKTDTGNNTATIGGIIALVAVIVILSVSLAIIIFRRRK